jgi:hypothetical protein
MEILCDEVEVIEHDQPLVLTPTHTVRADTSQQTKNATYVLWGIDPHIAGDIV